MTPARQSAGAARRRFTSVRLCALGATLAMTLAVLALSSTPAFAAFGVAAFDGAVSYEDGAPYTQAGGHPDAVSVSFEVNTVVNNGVRGPDGGALKDVRVDVPPGLVGNPTAMPACPKGLKIPSSVEALDLRIDPNTFCPVNSIVGIATIQFSGERSETRPTPVFNMEPPPGLPAQFALSFQDQRVYLDPVLRSDGDYGLNVRVRKLNQAAAFLGSTVTLWGVPADHSHDSQRCLAFLFTVEEQPVPRCDGFGAFPLLDPHPALVQPRAFLTNPTRCTAPGEGLLTSLLLESWNPEQALGSASFISHLPPGYPLPREQWGAPQGPTGCERLPFEPTIEVTPDSTVPDAATGLAVELTFPQDGTVSPTGLGTAHLKRATVTLPEGMTVSPSSAHGLGGCSDAQLAVGTLAKADCPSRSKVGTVEAETPLLAEKLQGSIFVGTQKSDDPESGDLFRIFLVLENDERGIRIKLRGKVRANAATGRLETTFDDNPQLPVSRIALRFKSGDQAPLVNPPTCGTKTVTTNLSSWGGQTATPSDSFTIDCPGVTGFSPSFAAGVSNPTGGAYSPFSVRIDRPDRQQYLAGLTMRMPQGLIAKLKGVPLCSQAAAVTGTCPAGSRVGTATVGAGPGLHPFYVSGPVFLTGPYGDAPYGLAVAVRALAGPFDLGTVVVRQAIYVDPVDAHLKVVSDPLPTIVKGVPLRLRSINVDVDRPSFVRNPTSCATKQIRATLTSTVNTTLNSASRFRVGDCRALRFAPKVSFRLTGRRQTTAGGHPGLTSVVTQRPGEANIRKVQVRLPLSLALDPENAESDSLCEFAEGQKAEPRCPRTSIVGSAVARTPVLNRPLRGPVYFVKNVRRSARGNLIRTLPTLLIALRGEVALNVRARTNVSADKLVTTFPIVPDAPVSRFELRLRGGPKGILTVSRGRLCGRTQVTATVIDAHNGKRVNRGVRMRAPCDAR